MYVLRLIGLNIGTFVTSFRNL